MKEQGIVTKLMPGGLVEVAFQKSDACAKCGACHAMDEKMVGIEAHNGIGAKREDIVEIDIPDAEIVKSSLIVYLIPVLFLLGGYLIGAAIARGIGLSSWEEGIGVGSAIAALAASFIVVNWYDRQLQRENSRAKVLRIISPR